VVQFGRADRPQTPPAALDRDQEVGVLDNRNDGLRKDPVLGFESVDGACIVKLGGELDLYNADNVREALSGAVADSAERVVVDLAEVEFIDSTALGVLIEARTKLRNRGAFLLAAPGLETRRALQISGLDRHFAVHDSVPDALSAEV
jgi:anti-sigma B factor antagonist